MHSFKEGDKVHVINQTMGGRFFVEGEVRVVSLLDDIERYLVRFPDGMEVERFVDPAAQEDPEMLVWRMNDNQPWRWRY